jgi:rubrerythrin
MEETMVELDKQMEKLIISFQQNEIDGHEIYSYLAAHLKDKDDQAVVAKIASDELRHYKIWKQYSGRELKANRFKVFWYKLLFHLFGYTFVIKLQENG